jgi:hypothetical protein
MNKKNLLLGAFIASLAFLLGCSSDCDKCDTCGANNPSSSSVKPSSSSECKMEDQVIPRKPITISSEKSYADIDGEPVAYEKEGATNNLKKIDLVAYCGTGNGLCKNNSIYRPKEIKGGGLFWNPLFIGSDVFLFEIPEEKSGVFKTALLYSDIQDTVISLNNAGYLHGSGVDEIPIKKGKVFFVGTSDEKNRFVSIKEESDQSVELEILPLLCN